jgi:hypothetical protein
MPVTYKLISLPLHAAKPEEFPNSFDIRIVSNLEFAPGTATTSEIATAVAGHPILNRPDNQPIEALAVDFMSWVNAGRPLTGISGVRVTLTYVGAKALTVLRATLQNYLSRPADVPVTEVRHDNRFDALLEDSFVDVAQVHDDLFLVQADFQARAAERFGLGTDFAARRFSSDHQSYDKARWLNAYVATAVLEAVFGDAGQIDSLSADVEVRAAVQRLRAGIAKIQSRIEDTSAVTSIANLAVLRTTTAAGETPVSVSDPNVAIHAAFKNSLLSEECGLTTRWRAIAELPINGDHILFLQATSFAGAPFPVVLHPTAFRRVTHTHPLSFADITQAGQPLPTTNSSLAYLNEDGQRPRYKATAINAETAIIQNTVLQLNNSISNTISVAAQQGADFTDPRDDRPPQLLADEYHGANEPECSGLTLSAPNSDLATPVPLADPQRESAWPCLFLEDFWIGFRLDLADNPVRPLRSVHKQVQEITLSAVAKKLRGAVEDFFAKEQPAQPPATNSTEIARYIGMSSAQAVDYQKFLGTHKKALRLPDAPFDVNVVGYSGVTALLFGHVYRYRLRNVFVGGMSLSPEEADTISSVANYVQDCPFFRARSFRPGELISSSFDEGESARRSIFLTTDTPTASVWLVPTPVDMDTARYHGIFLRQKSEEKRHLHRAFVQDIHKHFRGRPSNLKYFFDPDVAEVAIRVAMLNGDPDSIARNFTYQSGAYCELVEHLHLPMVRARYGQHGKWESFQPIEIRLSASSDHHPRMTKHGRMIHIRVPPSAEMEVSILPEVSEAQLRRTAVYAASTVQLQLRGQARFVSGGAPVPAMAEQKLHVVHCVKAPSTKPFMAGSSTQYPPADNSILVADRAPLKETAELRGYIQVDAASAGQVRLEALWTDIDDNPLHDRPVLAPGTTASPPKSIVFDKHAPPSGAAEARAALGGTGLFAAATDMTGVFGFQCAENKIFLGSPPDQTAPQASRACILNFADARRKQAAVAAICVSRYKRHFKAGPSTAFEKRSEKVLVDVPASMRLAAPDISHVVPLSRDSNHTGPIASTTQRLYAMRIYVRRPWFLSGPGERLAIVCRAGSAPQVATASLDKFVTQWGEDPLERPRRDVTRNAPRASDFRRPDREVSVPLDEAFYPKRSIEGTAEVLYRDNLQITDPAGAQRTVSAASFALRRDPSTRLWFCDVGVANEFIGWCGLALYRHQPHSHEDFQLSETPAWVYGAVLHGEQVAWTRREGKLRVTVGPVFDPNVTFELDPVEYDHGISRNLVGPAADRVPFQKYDVNGRTFFEAVVHTGKHWSLVKRRFGAEVASMPLTVNV